MVFLLSVLSFSYEDGYSIIPPFSRTDVSEIGNWSLRGSAVSWKNSIRLTSDAQREQWGAVCQRAPIAFKDWSISLELSVNGAESGGESLTFLYSDTVCPQQPDEFNGFQITFDTQHTDSDGYTPITFSERTFNFSAKRTTIRIRNIDNSIKVLITKTDKYVTAEYTTFTRYVPLFRAQFETVQPLYGYFTIFAVASPSLSDNTNVHAIRTQSYSPLDYSHISEELLTENRKVLESDAVKRREAKIARRDALLPTMFQYLSTMEKHENTLGRVTSKADMRDSFALVEEAAKRGMEAVTIDMLKVFINRYLQDTLAAAGKKVNLAMDQFDGTKGEMMEMWQYLREQLILLAIETKGKLRELAYESFQAAKSISVDHVSQNDLKGGLEKVDGRSENLSVVLVVIMGFELIAYVVFFVMKHQKTGGFKKID